MRAQEEHCFRTKLAQLEPEISYDLSVHNIVEDPDGYLETWHDFDLFLVGGSGDYGCVNNNKEWFVAFCGVLREMVQQRRSIFCSCFGHQALATALGGRVVTDRDNSELGTRDIFLSSVGEQDPLFEGIPTVFKGQLGHNDRVDILPPGAVLLAYNDRCPIQSYRLENQLIYATQFHPELDHEQNQERAMGYLQIYGSELTTPEKLSKMFRPSTHASSLIARFVRLHLKKSRSPG